jgi:hypothetical protein
VSDPTLSSSKRRIRVNDPGPPARVGEVPPPTPAGVSLFADGGETWIPFPTTLLHAHQAARDAWLALMVAGGGRAELTIRTVALARVMRRSIRCCQVGLATLERLGIAVRLGSRPSQTIFIRARLSRDLLAPDRREGGGE